jgi:HEPN domain-containing protein
MPERSRDWLRQAEADLQLARTARDAGHHEWAAFASHQAAEKAIKAIYQQMHAEAWGHALTALLQHLPNAKKPKDELMEKAMVLDRHYIPTRYPNGFERGAPMDYYSRKDADEAISNAEAIIEFCQNHIH